MKKVKREIDAETLVMLAHQNIYLIIFGILFYLINRFQIGSNDLDQTSLITNI